jgi:hypothetical protein
VFRRFSKDVAFPPPAVQQPLVGLTRGQSSQTLGIFWAPLLFTFFKCAAIKITTTKFTLNENTELILAMRSFADNFPTMCETHSALIELIRGRLFVRGAFLRSVKSSLLVTDIYTHPQLSRSEYASRLEPLFMQALKSFIAFIIIKSIITF